MTESLSFGLADSKTEISINDFFSWKFDPDKDYISDVKFLYNNVFDDYEKEWFDYEYDSMSDHTGEPLTLPDHKRHGKTQQCKFCLIELAEVILRDRQE